MAPRKDILKVPHPQCYVPSMESCHLRDIQLLSSNVSKVGTVPLDWTV